MARSKTFQPGRYGQSVQKNRPNTFRQTAGIMTYTKGNESTITVDVNFLHNTLEQLFTVRDQRVDNLSDVDKSAFDMIHNISMILYDSDSYNVIREMVDKHFAKVKTCQPMTIGWYMKGYTSNTDNVPPACNMFNASTLSPLDKSIPLKCDKSVILAEYINDSYTITMLSHVENSDTAYLYVNSHDINSYKGFSASEKNSFKSSGIKKVLLWGYTSKYGDIRLLIDREIMIDDLKNRSESENHNTSNSAAIAICVILVILVIIILIWAANRN